MKYQLTHQEVCSLLDYDPVTGTFTWKSNVSNRIKKGSIAGKLKKGNKYSTIMIKGHNYYAHIIAWFIYYKTWPIKFIDHINTLKGDNRLVNLREVTNSQNKQNMKMRVDNQTGYKGVYFNKKNNTYRAIIGVNGKKYNLGSFKTAKEAHNAYWVEAQKVHGIYARS